MFAVDATPRRLRADPEASQTWQASASLLSILVHRQLDRTGGAHLMPLSGGALPNLQHPCRLPLLGTDYGRRPQQLPSPTVTNPDRPAVGSRSLRFSPTTPDILFPPPPADELPFFIAP